VFEDVKSKGTLTPVSKLKAKLVRALYPGIDWRIIT
jgi:chromosomal replication initiator protein